MADLQAIEEELLRRGVALPAAPVKKKGFTREELLAQEEADFTPMPAQESQDGFFSRMGQGAVNTLKSRALGLGQGVYEALGETDSPTYKLSQDVANELRKRGEGLGVAGVIGGIAADPVTWATLPMAGGSLLQLAKTGATAGAASGATTALASDKESRLANVARDALIGAVAAPVIGAGARKLGGVVGSAADTTFDVAKKAGSTVSQAIKSVTGDDALSGIAAEFRTGITTPAQALKAVEDLGKEAVDLVKQGVKSGLSPEMAVLNARAKVEGVSLTADILTQNPKLQALVDASRQGVLGDDALKIVSELDATNKSNFAAWRDKLGNLVAAGDNAGFASIPLKELNETSVASQIGDAVRQRAESLKMTAQEAYKLGAETKSKVMIDEFKRFVPEMSASLRQEGFDIADMPILKKQFGTINKAMDVFGKRNAQIGYKELEVFKKRLYQAAQSASTPSEKTALERLHSAYRNKLDNIIENDLLINPDEAAKTLRKAPALWREYQETIFGKDGKKLIGDIVTKNYNDKQIANLLTGDRAVTALRELKVAIGDGAELGNARAQFFNRIIGGGLGESATDVTAQNYGAKVFTNNQRFKMQNKELYDELFTPDAQEAIDTFAKTLRVYVTKQKSSVNPSNTAIMQQQLQNGMNRMLSRFGVSGDVLGGVIKTLGEDLSKASDEKAVIEAVTNPLKALGEKSTIAQSLMQRAGGAAGIAVPSTAGMQMVQPLSDVPEFQIPAQYAPLEQQSPDLDLIEQELRKRGIDPNNMTQAPQGNPANDTLSMQVPDMLKQHEGLLYNAYNDTTGNRTVGYGFNMQSGIAPKLWRKAGIEANFGDVYRGKASITPYEAERLAQVSYDVAIEDAQAVYSNFAQIPQHKQEALLSLAYQHGRPSLMKNHKAFNAAVNRGDWIGAVNALKNSDYTVKYKSRAQDIARALMS